MTKFAGRAAVWAGLFVFVLGGGGLGAAIAQSPSEIGPSAVADTPPTHDATTGTMAGTAGTEGGASTYNVPLALPPGRAGMQPALSLNYNSRSGDGVMGMGWSISGTSSIHRCPQTVEQDNQSLGVSFTLNDRLCLDGQRLVRVGGTYGAAGAEYRTEIDSYARIYQAGGDIQSGTACFRVEQKSGRILHYGAVVNGTAPSLTCAASTAHARVVPGGVTQPLSWLVEKVEDRVGNNQLYAYTDYGNGEVLLHTISYTGFGAAAGDRLVTFAYEARATAAATATDSASTYLAGGLTMQTQALQSISASVAGSTVRSFTPIYAASAYSGRLIVTNLKDCATDASGTVCHPQTHFILNDGPLTYPLTSLAGINLPSPLGTLAPQQLTVMGDFDGDGTRDTVASVPESDGYHSFLLQMTGDRTVHSAVDLTGLLSCALRACTDDMDGSGRAALIEIPPSAAVPQVVSLGVWNLGRGVVATGNPFTTVASNVVYNYLTSGPILTADVNGDGKIDLVVVSPSGCGSDSYGAKKGVFVWLNNISGTLAAGQTAQFTPSNGTISAPLPLFCLARTADGNPQNTYHQQAIDHIADFNGDGLADFYLDNLDVDDSTTFVGIALTQRSGSTISTALKPCAPVAQGGIGLVNDGLGSDDECNWYNGYVTHFMDVNGDGLEDFVIARPNQGTWQVRLNQGNGTLGGVITPTGNDTIGLDNYSVTGGSGFAFRYANRLPLMDVDGDGKPEILTPSRTQGNHGFALKMCTIWKVTPQANGEGCPTANGIQPAGGSSPDVNQTCASYSCPEDPGSSTATLPRNDNQPGYPYEWNNLPAFGSYSAGTQHGGATTSDNSSYHLAALKFVQTGPSALRMDLIETPVVGRLSDSIGHTDDLFGDGLQDLVTMVGCINMTISNGSPGDNGYWSYPACAVVGNDSGGANWGPLTLPDAAQTPTAPFATSEVLYASVNQGVPGIGGSPAIAVAANIGQPTPPTVRHDTPATQLQPEPVLPDLMDASINGLGDTASWGYSPLSVPSSQVGVPLYTVPSGSGYVDSRHYYFQSSMPVVFGMLQSSGVGAGYSDVRSFLYGYSEAMYNHWGRGFQGFHQIIAENGNVVRTTTTYNQKFPLTGKIVSISIGGSDLTGQIVHQIQSETDSWICTLSSRTACPQGDSLPTPTGSTVYAPVLDDRFIRQFDLVTGAAIGHTDALNTTSTTATASGWDQYGNLKNQLVTRADDGAGGSFVASHTTATTNTYTIDTAGWWLDQLTQKAVTVANTYASGHALPAGASAPSHTTTTTYQWNTNRTPLSQTVQPGVTNQTLTTTYGYPGTSYGLPTSVAISGSGMTPSPRTTQYLYTKDGINSAVDGYFVLQTTNPLLQATTTQHRTADGQVSKVIDPNNLSTATTCDAFGHATQEQYFDFNNAQLSPPVAISYSICSNGSCPGGYGEDGNEDNAAYRITAVRTGYPTKIDWFDMLGQHIKHVERGFNGSLIESLTDYEDLGVIDEQSTPFFVGGVPYFTGFLYDQLNRPTLKQSPGAELDPTHGDVLTSYSYNGTTTTIKVRGANVPTTCSSSTNLCMDMSRSYDVLGRLEQTTQNNGSTSNYAVTKYWYDGAGHPVAAQDAEGNVIKASYNDIGQRTQLVDPDAGTSLFTYDALGEVTGQTDARGISIASVYDALGRQTQRTATDPSPVDATMKYVQDTWHYDSTASDGGIGLLDYATRSKGSVLTSLSQIWKEDESYESATKRLNSQTSTLDGQASPLVTSYVYDAWARESIRTYPSGLQVYNPLDSYGYAIGLQNALTFETYWTHTGEDAWGNITTESYPGSAAGSHQTYASTGQYKEKKWTSGVTTIDKWDYTYDSFGNVLTQSRALTNGTSNEYYTYDGLQRLASDGTEQCSGVLCGTQTPWHLGYTASGNLSYKGDYSQAIAGAYTYGINGCGPHGVGQVLAPSCTSSSPPEAKDASPSSQCGLLTYLCDEGGNVVGGNTITTATYDFNNQPLSISRAGGSMVQFMYDPNGARFKELSVTRNVWFTPRGFERTTIPGQAADRHELGPVVIDRVSGVDNVYYELRDRLGSAVAIGAKGSTTPDLRSYAPFGGARNGDFTAKSNGMLTELPITMRGFTGQEHLDDVWLLHMNGRVYDYQLGRFLSVDPVIQFPLNSQSLNPYSYVLNNPFTGKDPTGYLYGSICSVGSADNGNGCSSIIDMTSGNNLATPSGQRAQAAADHVASTMLMSSIFGNGADQKQTSQGFASEPLDGQATNIGALSFDVGKGTLVAQVAEPPEEVFDEAQQRTPEEIEAEARQGGRTEPIYKNTTGGQAPLTLEETVEAIQKMVLPGFPWVAGDRRMGGSDERSPSNARCRAIPADPWSISTLASSGCSSGSTRESG